MKVKITTPENMRYYDCEYGTIIDVPLETYVAAVVASEIGSAPL
jgi:peptidoglycan hydrolase-like amidase